MALFKCPDCGKMVSENAISCPKCGCPNNGNFLNIDTKRTKVPQYIVIGLSAAIVLLLIFVLFVQPSYTNSPFYDLKGISCQEVVARYGKPDDTYNSTSYFEYTYDSFRFMGVKGELVFRFDDQASSGDLIFARWIIDGANYSESKLEKICDFYDENLDKRDVRDDGGYEWNNWSDNDRIWFRKPEYSKGYYEFEYRPW